MSTLSYFQSIASAAVLSDSEGESIRRSISTLESRLSTYFNNEVNGFRFGSSVRGTILPRNMDELSDIDYMIVFKDKTAKPQTYLDRLKRFSTAMYSSSETKQSHPSVVLELNHIKFDLVPAVSMWSGGYQIPDAGGQWRSTDPVSFSEELTRANKNYSNLLKPAIRIVKFWNAQRGYLFESFGLEKWMAAHWYWNCNNLADYVLHALDQFNPQQVSTQQARTAVERAKELVSSIRDLERRGQGAAAESEARKLIRPDWI